MLGEGGEEGRRGVGGRGRGGWSGKGEQGKKLGWRGHE